MGTCSCCLRGSACLWSGVWTRSIRFSAERNCIRQVVKEDKACLYEDWKEHIQPLLMTKDFKFDASYFGVEQYFFAKSLISSRSFEIDDYHGFGMVPLADLFNHKTGAENVHFTTPNTSSISDGVDDGDISGTTDEDKSVIDSLSSGSSDDELTNSGDDPEDLGDDPTTLEMIVVREVKAGAEVYNTYGTTGNAALLHRYGFTEPDNAFDIVNIDLDIVLKLCSSSFSSRYSRARLSLWRRLNYSGCTSQSSEYFEVSFSGEPQLELLTLLYIMFLPEDAKQKLGCMTDDFREAHESSNLLKLISITRSKCDVESDKINELLLTADVCRALTSLADMRESLYGLNSLKDDEGKLRRCCPINDRKLYHSMVLRVHERKILQRLRVYASRGCKAKKRKA